MSVSKWRSLCIVSEMSLLFRLDLSNALHEVIVMNRDGTSSQSAHSGLDADGFQLGAIEVVGGASKFFKVHIDRVHIA